MAQCEETPILAEISDSGLPLLDLFYGPGVLLLRNSGSLCESVQLECTSSELSGVALRGDEECRLLISVPGVRGRRQTRESYAGCESPVTSLHTSSTWNIIELAEHPRRAPDESSGRLP